jgi:hypothetical protein
MPTAAATPNSEGNQSPNPATSSSKQREKEALKKRLKELEDSLGRPSTTTADCPVPEASAQSALKQLDPPVSGATDASDVDDDDDGDLYSPETGNLTANGETPAPVPSNGVIETQVFDDEDGELYEPDSNTIDDMETRAQQHSSDSGKIGSQATTQSGTTNADAANTQLTAEMDAAIALDDDIGNGLNSEDAELALPTQHGLHDVEAGGNPAQGGVEVEDREIDDDDSENMYEPPHNVEPSAANVATTLAEDMQQSDEQEDDNEPMDISDGSDSSSESSDDYEPEQDIIPELFDLPKSPTQDQEKEVLNESDRSPIYDTLAPELHPATEQQMGIAVADPHPHPAPTSGFYKPYSSVLSRFKEYRYHPSFLDTVPGGHKSLTYSNNINSETPICPFEIGGRCNDKDCHYQHFKTSKYC